MSACSLRGRLLALAIGLTSLVAFAGQSAAAGVNLRGNIIHDGSGSGLYLIFAFRIALSDIVAGIDSRSSAGAFEVPEVPANESYVLLAFRDTNGNLLPGLGEPVGWYGSPFPQLVNAGTQDVTGLDIELQQRLNSEVRGKVIYNGLQGGRIWIAPHWAPNFNIFQIAGTPWTVTRSGDEFRSFVFSPGTYYLTAWVDVNSNLRIDEGEPVGTTDRAVSITSTGQVSLNNDIVLRDTGVAVQQRSWSQIKGLYDR